MQLNIIENKLDLIVWQRSNQKAVPNLTQLYVECTWYGQPKGTQSRKHLNTLYFIA